MEDVKAVLEVDVTEALAEAVKAAASMALEREEVWQAPSSTVRAALMEVDRVVEAASVLHLVLG